MRKLAESIAFPLLIIGTFGLLANEFIFNWGKISTLSFASANIIGLLALALGFLTKQKKQ
jgi:hypothetical protein